MAIAFTVEHKDEVSRQDTFRVNPEDVRPDANSRMIEAPGYAETVRERRSASRNRGSSNPRRCVGRRIRP